MAMVKALLKIIKGSCSTAQKQNSADELRIATCALLLEIAHADDEFLPEEEQKIEMLMRKHFNLPEETIFREIKELSEKKRAESIDLWSLTKTIKEHYSGEQKEKIIEMIWAIIYSDGTLSEHEDYLVHKLATLLDLDHRTLIDAKIKVLREIRQ